MILITGATGFIGNRLAAFFEKDNEPFYVVTRKANSAYSSRETVKVIVADIAENVVLPDDVTTIYHCAGVISKEEDMRNVNVAGTLHIAEAALKLNCRLIHLSSAGILGNSSSLHIDESVECKPQNLYEQTKWEAENVIRRYIDRGLRAQILRPTIVFGPGKDPEQDSFLQFVRSIKHGRYMNIGNGDGIYNIIHVDEVVRAMYALNDDNIPNGEAFFINTPVSFREFADVVKEETTNGKEPVRSIPYWAVLGVTAIMSGITLLTRKKMPLTFSRLKALTNHTVFAQRKLIEMTGYVPSMTVRDYIKQICREFSQKRLLDN